MMNEERMKLIEKIQKLPEQVADLVDGLSDEQMATHFIDGEWTVAQNVHHLCDSHMNSYIRCKLILTEENPTLRPYDQAVWAALPAASGADVAASLRLLSGLHACWTTFWQNLADEDWARPGFHPADGPVDLALQLRLYADHGEAHLCQIGHTLAARPLETLGENLTKTRLLAMVLSARVYFKELWHGLDEAQFLEPNVEEVWTLKDIIAHVVSWERWLCQNLETAVTNTPAPVPQNNDEVDRMNAEFTAENNDKSLKQVLQEFNDIEARIEAAITAVPEDALLDKDYYDWRNGRPLAWMVVVNTFGHYQDHVDPIVSKFH